ncbi:xanthine dehydrogenase family protein molybdopterin-binding subunit [Stakelama pacifica]|uniref:Xanthine dehydrogenase YagR molybdenum-binding subunit n=1 Tax=Stakelama pacifica TaxID=517720 RepID=A0A4R6FNH7_9SPHN|nr:xanthine dehydrogenase family protein molybdopterin-binding subunit [Stakelama pacifica]TDN82225.1 xanthine dehydrogenase YagR molybdenum-binding subunit [Stakelama pacifica]GGO95917.1 xanthine dehydrogenase [Stakelama pacifica]
MADHTLSSPERLSTLDRAVQRVLGQPIDRTDGPAKVSGDARYSFEIEADNALYGHILTAGIGAGRIDAIDADAARAAPGVVAVLVDDPRLPADAVNSFDKLKSWRLGHDIRFFGQAIGVVVAETQEAARAAARLVDIRYAPQQGRFTPDLSHPDEIEPEGLRPPVKTGDFDAIFAGATFRYDQSYSTPIHFPAAMEPQATLARWEDDELILHSSLQSTGGATKAVGRALDIDPQKVRVIAPFVGGGFGGKTSVGAEAIYAAIAAKHTGRPVKIVQTRRQVAALAHHRAPTRQRVRIATDADGHIRAFGHHAVIAQRDNRSFVEPVHIGTTHLYAGDARLMTVDLARADHPTSGAVRSPGEACGTLAVEVAMDEAAEALGLDPIEFRRRNEPKVSPANGKPFGTRKLIECYEEGARRFGWDQRSAKPASRREGDWWIGHGMAAAIRSNITVEARATVTLEADGSAHIETDMTDIGTGTYTILMQVVAEALGLSPDRVRVSIGDSSLPRSAGSGGSFGASSASSAAALACQEIAGKLAAKLDAEAKDLTLQDGHATARNRRVPLTELLGGEAISAKGHAKPGKHTDAHVSASYGAHFAEVAVNAFTGEVRVRRMTGIFDIGRVLNEKTARSQIVGGIVWGIGSVLHEDGVIDPHSGQFVNPDFGEYHIPTHADSPPIEVHFIEEVDNLANEAGAKGVGELGNSGAGAAVANAIYNACGIRVHDFPITLDKLLSALPEQD